MIHREVKINQGPKHLFSSSLRDIVSRLPSVYIPKNHGPDCSGKIMRLGLLSLLWFWWEVEVGDIEINIQQAHIWQKKHCTKWVLLLQKLCKKFLALSRPIDLNAWPAG
jgi:hypothetical protein